MTVRWMDLTGGSSGLLCRVRVFPPGIFTPPPHTHTHVLTCRPTCPARDSPNRMELGRQGFSYEPSTDFAAIFEAPCNSTGDGGCSWMGLNGSPIVSTEMVVTVDPAAGGSPAEPRKDGRAAANWSDFRHYSLVGNCAPRAPSSRCAGAHVPPRSVSYLDVRAAGPAGLSTTHRNPSTV